MLLRQSVLVVLTLSATVIVEGYDNNVRDNSLFVHEEFLPNDSVEEGNRPLLRGRELQSSCRATNPRNIYICGSPDMADDSCQSSFETCAGMSYGCSCDGSGEFSCNYCRVQTSNAVICQVIGSSLTFPHPDEGMVTCSCDYVNGQVRESCVQAVSTRTPGVGAEGASVANVPVPAPRVAVPATVITVRNPVLPAALFPTPMFTGNGFGSALGGTQAPVTAAPVSEPPVTEAPVIGGAEPPVIGEMTQTTPPLEVTPPEFSETPGKGSVKGKGSGKGSVKGKGSGKGSVKEGSGKGSVKGKGSGKGSVKEGSGKASVKGKGSGKASGKGSVKGTGTGTGKASEKGTGKGTGDKRRKH